VTKNRPTAIRKVSFSLSLDRFASFNVECMYYYIIQTQSEYKHSLTFRVRAVW